MRPRFGHARAQSGQCLAKDSELKKVENWRRLEFPGISKTPSTAVPRLNEASHPWVCLGSAAILFRDWDIRSRAPCRSTCETTICGSIRLSIVQTESRVTQIRTSEPATRICRAEVFNVLNHANFSHPELIVFSAMTSRARPGSFEKRRTASARSSSRYDSSSDTSPTGRG